jgi:hypothetical protein
VRKRRNLDPNYFFYPGQYTKGQLAVFIQESSVYVTSLTLSARLVLLYFSGRYLDDRGIWWCLLKRAVAHHDHEAHPL